jgi:heme oxygenase
MQPSAFHTRLKEQMMPLHAKLETATLPKKLFMQTISVDEYAEYLSRLYALHYCIENEFLCFQWRAFGINIDEYLRLDLLEKDLRILKRQLEQNIPCYYLKMQSFEHAIGYLYVLTGSTMGGMILSKKADALFKGANNYFEAFGEQTQTRWMQFLQALGRYGEENGSESQNAIIEGASQCYNDFIVSFNG